jgi:hypothetical protein
MISSRVVLYQLRAIILRERYHVLLFRVRRQVLALHTGWAALH